MKTNTGLNISGVLLCGLVAVGTLGCGSAGPSVGSVDTVKGTVLLPTGKPLKGGRVVLQPTGEFCRVAKPVTADLEKDGTFVIDSSDSETGIAAAEYKVFVVLSGSPQLRSLRRSVPEKYQSISDDETDLFVNLAEQADGLVLKMNKNKT